MKKILYSFIIVIFMLVITGCSVKSKTYSKEGVSVTLLSDFEEYESSKWDMYLENDDLAFMSNRLKKTTKIENADLTKFTLEQYTMYILSTSGVSAPIYKVDGMNGTFYYFYYNVYEDKNDPLYGYMMVVMEGEDHFYTMNFSSDYAKFENMKKVMFQYAMTIAVE